MINFPANPIVGQEFTAAGVLWIWDGVKWVVNGLSTAYLPLVGGNLTGPLTLDADPAAPLQPVTEQMFNRYPMIGDNRIINGDMRIDQRNSGAVITSTGYTVDRWQLQSSPAGIGESRQGGASLGFSACLVFISTSAYVSAAGDYFLWSQPIEADMISDFQWGTSQAQPVTLSFWATSSLTGMFSGCLYNGNASGRTYLFSYNIPIANTWVKITVTIPGDTVGPWVMNGNAAALYVQFDLGSGANYRGPANVWGSNGFCGVTGSQSIVATNGAALYITGVKLEIGTVATPFNHKSLSESLADCQRYCIVNDPAQSFVMGGYNQAGAQDLFQIMFPTTMRAVPTVNIAGAGGTNWTGVATSNINPLGFVASITVAVAGAYIVAVNWNADAEL
jgi:hypothetical protein